MAEQKDLDYSYSLIDRMFRLSMGDSGDFSGAKYDGDFSLSLEKAQQRKYEFICEQLNIGQGSRVLDMGCGWGPFLSHIRAIGAVGVGMTLSTAQAASCRRQGLDVRLGDCRRAAADALGTFDAIACIGAFEAFCSKEEWRAGRQEEVYRDFFRTVAALLPAGGRFYMQTMTLGPNMIDPRQISLRAEKGSAARLCALLEEQFPGHWLPAGAQQIVDAAAPSFRLRHQSSGRLDYIETQKQWQRRFQRFSLKKYAYFLTLVPRYLGDREFRRRIALFDEPANRRCFEKEIIEHYRLVFAKA